MVVIKECAQISSRIGDPRWDMMRLDLFYYIVSNSMNLKRCIDNVYLHLYQPWVRPVVILLEIVVQPF